jgi:hypothetical protein
MTTLLKQVALRSFPFPYRAALAICSDIDGCTRETFIAVHRFLNWELGLPVADSMFGVGRETRQLAYFLPDGVTPGPDAPLIRAAIRDGLIDSLHSWGDFNDQVPDPQFLRKMAASLATDFGVENLSLKIWINHGSPTNLQNFLTRTKPKFAGDDPRSPLYTADLARDLGVQYYWGMELAPWPLSVWRQRSSPEYWGRVGVDSLKNLLKTILGQKARHRSVAQVTELGLPLTLRDGWQVWAFTRFNRHPQGIWGLPTRHTLRYALAPKVLKKLLREAGFLILYTHLGLPRQAPGPLFPDPDRQALENLADTYHRDLLWVDSTLRVLTYWRVRQTLDWQAGEADNKLIIDLKALREPDGTSRLPEVEELAGLSFYSPKPFSTILRLAGRELPTRIIPTDHTGREGIAIPLTPSPLTRCLEMPWDV